MQRILFWVGVALSAIFLILALRGLKLEEFGQDIRQANLFWLIPGIIAYFIAVGVRAWRWAYMLRGAMPEGAQHRPIWQRLFPIVVIGYMGNNIYPARIGELVRAYILQRKENVPIPFSLATVFLERLIDAIVMVTFVLIGLPRVVSLPDSVRSGITLASIIFGIATAIFFWLALAPHMAERIAGVFISWLLPTRLQPIAQNFVSKFVAGMACLRRPADLLAVVGSSAVVWLIETIKYWCIAQGFHLTVGFVDLMLVNGISNLFTIIPALPGAVGTFDTGSIIALTALGVAREPASAYTLVLHVALWLPITALGAYFMLREGLRWADLKRMSQ
jgi:glycosyltransferase 2 family protein